MSGGNSSGSGSGNDEGWGSKFLKVAGAAAATVVVAGGLYSLLASSSSPEAPFEARAHRTSKEPNDDDDDDDGVGSKVVRGKKPDIGWAKPVLALRPQDMLSRPCVKLNVDGSCDHVGRTYAGCGGVLSDASGKWLLGFAQKLDANCDVHVTEMQAILTGLRLAREMNFKKVAVESDSKTVVDTVKKGVKDNHRQFDIISHIRQLLSDPKWQVTLEYISEEANRVADRLAKSTRNLLSYDLQKYSEPPDDCKHWLKEDEQGVSYLIS